MLDVITSFLIPFLVLLSVLVLIHEFGHFITAKWFGIKVEEFGFGFPPRLFGKKIGETIYSINWLPIGGFVKLYGEDEAGSGSVRTTNNQEPITKDLNRAFFTRPPWQKAVIVLAGVIMNFALAVVFISYLFSGPGVELPKGYAEVAATLPNTPASKLDLKKGDRIVSFNNKEVKTIRDLRTLIGENKEKQGELIITRAGEKITYKVTPQKLTEKGKPFYAIGVELSDSVLKKYPWYSAPFFGTIEAFKFSWMILAGLGDMIVSIISGHGAPGVAGPVAVAQATGEVVKLGLVPTLWFAAVLSLNLAVVNVLPIPALDGGRLFFILIELVTRKKVSPKYEAMAHAVGLAVLLSLILLITFFDVARLISGQSLIPQ